MFESLTEDKTFSHLDLKEKDLSRLIFSGVTFETCDFSSSNWTNARFSNCRFKNCNIALVNVAGCRLEEITFEESKVTGVDFFKCEKHFFSIQLLKCRVQTCNFTDLEMKRASFQSSQLREAYFSNTNLQSANFSDTDLLGTLFHNANLEGANFQGARNYSIDPRTNRIKKAKFSLPEAVSLLSCFNILLD